MRSAPFTLEMERLTGARRQYCAHRQDASSLHKLPIKGEQRTHDIAPDNMEILFNGGMT